MIKYDILTDNIPYEDLYILMKESFVEREEQGLNFTVLSFTLDDFKKALCGKIVVVAYDENPQTGEHDYLGFRQIIIKGTEAHAGLLAVSPKCKRKGIGSKIEIISEKVALKEGCRYMTSDTAEDAISSVKWHLNNRYFKYKLHSHSSTNYYTVYFRKQLKPHWFWSIRGLRNIHYYFSAILSHLYHNKDGSPTAIGKLIRKIRSID